GSRLKQVDPALTDEEWQAILDPFALHGRSVYTQLFENAEPSGFTPDQVPLVRDAVRSVLSHPQAISVTCPPATPGSLYGLFPWGFLYGGLYDSGDRSKIKLKHFWGFRHIIQQELPGTSK